MSTTGGKTVAQGASSGGGSSAAAGSSAAGATAAVRKKKGKRNVVSGSAFIHATFNNTIVTFTDTTGGVVAWSSSGCNGFKGSRKSTPFAAQVAGETASRKAREIGMKSVVVYVKGPGAGRESALRAIHNSGIQVTLIKDITPVPHNGCRPRKSRRV